MKKKLSNQDVDDIRRYHQEGLSLKEIHLKFQQVTYGTIYDIIKKRCRNKHNPEILKSGTIFGGFLILNHLTIPSKYTKNTYYECQCVKCNFQRKFHPKEIYNKTARCSKCAKKNKNEEWLKKVGKQINNQTLVKYEENKRRYLLKCNSCQKEYFSGRYEIYNTKCSKCELPTLSPGTKVNSWTVIKYLKNQQGKRKYFIQCKCGYQTYKSYSELSKKYCSRSCSSCSKKDKTDIQTRVIRKVYGLYKSRAKKRKINFSLNIDQFKDIVLKDCGYCGKKPSNYHNYKGKTIFYTGIDRIDNSKGYLKDNITPCCKQCNSAKRDLSLAEFKKWIHAVYNKFLGSND